MRILIVSDAWYPQVNGVVRTLDTVAGELRALGHEVLFITPDLFRNLPCPTYPEIRLALPGWSKLRGMIEDFRPDCVHLSTEGPLGWAVWWYCRRRGFPHTTAFHTRFPEYVQARFRTPLSWSYAVLRRFHGQSRAVMVATPTIEREIGEWGIGDIKRWTRGVNLELFRPRDKAFLDLPRPVSAFVGRVAVEKNIGAFLSLDLPGTKLVVGDGPQMDEMKRKHPEVVFVGAKKGEDLAAHYAAADVFVFPSRTDTFGLVLLEALASGVPVAAYPVPGPIDVIGADGPGVLDEDLAAAAKRALEIDPADCRAFAERFSWRNSAEQFLANLHPFAFRTDAERKAETAAQPAQ